MPWRRKWQPTPVFLPGESHGRRRLVGYSPWGHTGSDTTEQLHFTSLPDLRSRTRTEVNSMDLVSEPTAPTAGEFSGKSCLAVWWRLVLLNLCWACVRTYVLRRLSRLSHLDILWASACQAAQSMGFSRQEYWSGLVKLFVSATIFKH